MSQQNKKNKKTILLLGASFNTGNLGVSALAESSIKCILQKWPDATIKILGGSRSHETTTVSINKKKLQISNIPIRFSKNIFLKNHIITLIRHALFLKLFKSDKAKTSIAKKNPFIKQLLEADLVCDITGGDSFSDIYGMSRFTQGFIRKWMVLLYNIPLMFLPQTYGPFSKAIARKMAKYITSKALMLFSRDQDGIDFLKSFLNEEEFTKKVRLMPDVAFTLDAEKPKKMQIGKFKKDVNTTLVGLNISGLLYNGGYTKNNMFKLKVDYIELVHTIIDTILSKKNIKMLLVPHVFPENEYAVESDPFACKTIYDELAEKYKDKLYLVEGSYDHKEIKHIIKQTDFFMGARMHSCIAAISQGIPTVGLAYSKKFTGVFETVAMDDYVADLMNESEQKIITTIENTFKQRKKIANKLKHNIPEIKKQVLQLFTNIDI